MEIKILCDRCFENIREKETVYKYGSAVYCEKCNREIRRELFWGLVSDYINTNYDEKEQKKLEIEIAKYEFVGNGA